MPIVGPQKPKRKRRQRPPRGLIARRSPLTSAVTYYYRDQRNGKDRRILLGHDYAEALRKHAELEAGKTLPAAITLAAAVDAWLQKRIATGRNAKGQRLARARAERYVLEHFGRNRHLASLTPDDMRTFRLWLENTALDRRQRRLSATTVGWILGDIRNLLRWATEAGYIDRSPFPSRLMPRIQQQPPKRLTPEEEAAVRAIPEPWAFTVRFLLGTGLRWAEACRAQRSDLEGNLLVVAHTKSGKLRRIPLDHDPALLAELRLRVGRLCPYATGSPGSFANVVRRHSGVQRFHVHQARHTFACNWLARGGSLPALQQLLGHASVTTTQRYASLFTEHLEEEARRLAR